MASLDKLPLYVISKDTSAPIQTTLRGVLNMYDGCLAASGDNLYRLADRADFLKKFTVFTDKTEAETALKRQKLVSEINESLDTLDLRELEEMFELLDNQR